METRNLLFYLAIAILVYFAVTRVASWLLPPPPVPPAATQPIRETAPSTHPSGETSQSAPTSGPARNFAFRAGPAATPFTIGGGPNDVLGLVLNPRGAAVEVIHLTARAKDHYRYRKAADSSEPYAIVSPVEGPQGPVYSYATSKIHVVRDQQERTWSLDDVAWNVVEQQPLRAVFAAELQSLNDAAPLLRITKTYELASGLPLVSLRLAVENLSNESFSVVLEQDGPVGIPQEGRYMADRFLVAAFRGPDGQLEKLKYHKRADLTADERTLVGGERSRLEWTGLVNKYFTTLLRPLTPASATPRFHHVQAALAAPQTSLDAGDMRFRLESTPRELPPGGRDELAFQLYTGPKDSDVMEQVDPAFVDRGQIGFVAVHDLDSTCCCQFAWLTSIMSTLLELIAGVVRNYGVAILVLVLIVRSLLHPLSVFQQKSMYRMQESMGRIQPKLQAIKERYPNDKVKQNQEQMKLYAEEHVNPMAGMVGMVPMFIQMPILIALWTALNSDVHLRHAPLDGVWIRDLAAPDALVTFAGPGLTIPVLGWLVPSMFANIPSLNLLPLLMGVAMWVQQKYMPKPQMQAKQEAAKAAAQAGQKPPTSATGLTPEEQLRQQQMIGYLMAVLFPFMLYYQASGLCIYWMFSNVFGIVESLIIRKQLKAERERREKEGPKPPPKGKPGLVAGFFKRLAEQAEQIQKRADNVTKDGGKGPKGGAGRKS